MSQKVRGESICKAFDDAMECLGGIKGMAKIVGVSESHIRRFRRGDYKMKLEYTMKIEAATKGKVKVEDLSKGYEVYKMLAGAKTSIGEEHREQLEDEVSTTYKSGQNLKLLLERD